MNTPNKHDPIRAKKHFAPRGHVAVSASPFNGVKLELALILVIGLILWLILERLFPHRIEAFIMLVGYSLLAAGWIILRVRNVLKQTLELKVKQAKP
ncbi:MAG: hypothetical protein JKY90_05795 [Gammaproteobacteria bacterium]|nr:hypothetical protein [Gammaproteobacteria bacterium]